MVLKKARCELFNSWFLLRNLFHIITTGQIQGMSDNLTVKAFFWPTILFYKRNFLSDWERKKSLELKQFRKDQPRLKQNPLQQDQILNFINGKCRPEVVIETGSGPVEHHDLSQMSATLLIQLVSNESFVTWELLGIYRLHHRIQIR